MRGIKLFLISFTVTLLLSGCTGSPIGDLNAKKAEVNQYNTVVGNTLDAYAKAKIFADSQKANLLTFLVSDSKWGSTFNVPKLSTEDSKIFETYGITSDKFFTSYGADAVREVLVLNGKGKNMFATVIWRKDKVESVSRVVKGL